MTQRVLITGASDGIGKACAYLLAHQGWQVFLHGRNEEKLIELSKDIKDKHEITCPYFVADLTDSSTIKPLIQAANKALGGVDVLIHCAGSMMQSSLAVIKEDDIDQQFNLHLKSSLLLAQLSSRLMLRNKKGAMVFVSSAVASQGAVGQVLYSAAKSGLTGLVKSLSKELGPHGIRVNAVAPGFIETELVAEYSSQQREQLTQATSLKRLGCAEDVAKAIMFLASNEANYITGQTLTVDAGLSLP